MALAGCTSGLYYGANMANYKCFPRFTKMPGHAGIGWKLVASITHDLHDVTKLGRVGLRMKTRCISRRLVRLCMYASM